MQNVLVTGGAGYIGSHVCKALAASGYQPVVFDSLVTGNRWAIKWGPFEHGDIRSLGRLVEVMQVYKPIAIMHFAASAYVGESVIDPGKYYLNNVAGSLSLIQAARQCNINSIVFSSSCATYGETDEVPILENAVQRPINPYGWSKLMIEQILRDYVCAYGVSAVVLRYFNAAGADPAGEIGECHEPETHLIPLVLNAVAQPEQPIKVFGDDYPTTDGTCIRDYTHVTDIADAHLLSLQACQEKSTFRAFNLGTGSGHSVSEIVEMAEGVTGRPVHRLSASRRAGDPARLVASPAKARAELGWRTKHSELHEIVSTAWTWMNKS